MFSSFFATRASVSGDFFILTTSISGVTEVSHEVSHHCFFRFCTHIPLYANGILTQMDISTDRTVKIWNTWRLPTKNKIIEVVASRKKNNFTQDCFQWWLKNIFQSARKFSSTQSIFEYKNKIHSSLLFIYFFFGKALNDREDYSAFFSCEFNVFKYFARRLFRFFISSFSRFQKRSIFCAFSFVNTNHTSTKYIE